MNVRLIHKKILEEVGDDNVYQVVMNITNGINLGPKFCGAICQLTHS